MSIIRYAWPLTLKVPWLLRAAWTPWLNYGMLKVGKRCPHWQYVLSYVLFSVSHTHIATHPASSFPPHLLISQGILNDFTLIRIDQ